MSTLEARIFRIVSQVLNIPLEEITLETSYDTVVNWDSINMVNLLLALEAEFNVGLEVEDATDLVSVQDILDILSRRGAS
jgi:acyl carrier protein